MRLARKIILIFLMINFVLPVAIKAVPLASTKTEPPLRARTEPPLEWIKILGGPDHDWCWSVEQTSDGGYIAVGFTESFGAGEADVYLVKIDSMGNEIWSRTYGGTFQDEGLSIQQTKDGGYIISGSTQSSTTGWSWGDVFLIKTDFEGNEIWSRTFGGKWSESGNSVKQTSDGGYIIAGYTTSFGVGSYDVWLIKTDPEGISLWNKTFGGFSEEQGESMQQTDDGGYIIVGTTDSFGAGKWDMFLVKTDQKGNEIWHKTFGGPETEHGVSVQLTAEGGYVLAGYTESFGAGEADIYLVKVDSYGNEIWSRTYGGPEHDWCWSVEQTSDGGYIAVGFTESFGAGEADVYLIKTDSDGNMLWQKTFGGPGFDVGTSIQHTVDKGYIISGFTENNFYIIKITPRKMTLSERQLTLASDYGLPLGGGIYSRGSTASFSISPSIILSDSDIQIVFSGWTSESLGGYTGQENHVTVIMNNNITETANWKIQYYLTVETDEDGIVSPRSGWYDSGDIIILNAESDRVNLIRRVFKCWSGDIESDSNKINIVLDGPKTVYALWATDYTLAYIVGGIISIVIVTSSAVIYKRRRQERALEEEFKRQQIEKGLIQYRDRWGTPEEVALWKKADFENSMKEKGFVEHKGQWITPDVFMRELERERVLVFEEKQREKGLFKFQRRGKVTWGTIEQVQEWKRIDLGIMNNFQDYNPRDFEVLIGRLFEKMGYIIELGRFRRDLGIDVVARNEEEVVVVEVKKWKIGNNVGNDVVRSVLGALWQVPLGSASSKKAVVVTSSDFTVMAREQARGSPVELWDNRVLSQLLEKYFIQS